MKKNTAGFVLALIGAIFGLIGGILWTACADAVNGVSSSVGGSGNESTIYMVCFIILGIGGAVISLIGGIQAFGYKKGGLVLTIVGLLFQIGMLIASCVYVGGFSFLLNVCTIIALILLAVALIFIVKNKPVAAEPVATAEEPSDKAE